jgi:hypothetical protein
MQLATLEQEPAVSHFSIKMQGPDLRRKIKRTGTKALCLQIGMALAPIIFTASGGIEGQFQRQFWHPHWTT